jgi:trimeric autotransporter adhesin
MGRRTRARSAGTILSGVLAAALAASPVVVAAHGPLPRAVGPSVRTADLGMTLGADGTFRGATRVEGAAGTAAWTLVSDLAAGEPPRFAPAGDTSSPAANGSWSALGSQSQGGGALDGWVFALAVSGGDLYVGGEFINAAGIATADNIARWDGNAWSALGSDASGDGALDHRVLALAVSGGDLYVGGEFTDAAGIATADYVARWDGSAWSALGSDASGDGALDWRVNALAVSGSDVYVGGAFTDASGIPGADDIARWDGSAWSALGSDASGEAALDDSVHALAISGSDLWVGGKFTDAAGIATADHVARWDGSAWSAVGSDGLGDGALDGSVLALAVSGSDLYAGGVFEDAAAIATADFIARWDGSAWSAVGSVASGDAALDGWVHALAVIGSGLYVGGEFTDAAGIPATGNIAGWDGSAWSAVGADASGDGALDRRVEALEVTDGGLFVGGEFTDAAGIATADFVARWDASAAAASPGAASPGAASPGSATPIPAASPSGAAVQTGAVHHLRAVGPAR